MKRKKGGRVEGWTEIKVEKFDESQERKDNNMNIHRHQRNERSKSDVITPGKLKMEKSKKERGIKGEEGA